MIQARVSAGSISFPPTTATFFLAHEGTGRIFSRVAFQDQSFAQEMPKTKLSQRFKTIRSRPLRRGLSAVATAVLKENRVLESPRR